MKQNAIKKINDVFIIGIGGGSASGKTMFAKELKKKLSNEHTEIVDLDSYYHDFSHMPSHQRKDLNFDDPDRIDIELIISHIQSLKSGASIKKPRYCFEKHARTEKYDIIHPRPFVIVEGLFTLVFQELLDTFDLKIFVDASEDLRIIRRIQRDRSKRGRSVDSIIDQYLKTVRHAHLCLIEPSKEEADIIATWDNVNPEAIKEAVELIFSEYEKG